MSPGRAGWLLLLALVCCADQPLTQIVVVVDSDYDGFAQVEIAVDGFGDAQPVRIADLDRKPLPRRLALVHEGGPLGPIGVTVRAWVANVPDGPVLRERRSGIEFVRDQTRLLKVDLLFQCIMSQCPEACVAPGRCVDAERATKLRSWDPDYEPLDVVWKTGAGNLVTLADGGDALVTTGPDSGSDRDARPALSGSGGDTAGSGAADSGPDATVMIDAGPPEAVPVFTYIPSNFDPVEVQASAEERPDVLLDCPLPQFDSATLAFTAWCGDEPLVMPIKQSDDSDAVMLVMNTFSVAASSTLQLRGDKPIIFAVFGDAQVFGVIDASAHGDLPGPGAATSCGMSMGSTGPSAKDGPMFRVAAGGGSGGGFGSAGGRGGAGGGGMSRVDGGKVAGDGTLSPLRGGCPGGRGGTGDGVGGAGGAGGGAIQISAAGALQLAGEIAAGGGGGQPGTDSQDGGGGGGSGGAILLEGASLEIDSAARISANGGGGAGGQPSILAAPNSVAGEDGLRGASSAAGGDGANSGGAGGFGAWSGGGAGDAEDGTVFQQTTTGAGGGGGGGTGRIRINGAGSCKLPGTFSPKASVDCPSCPEPSCPGVSLPSCMALTRPGSSYYLCPGPQSFADARASCQVLGRDLVHVDDEMENRWLEDRLASGWAWIGASDMATEGNWRWLDDNTTFWVGTGTSGSEISGAYTAWSPPLEPNDTGDCARFENGEWFDQDCALTGPFFCE